jgi:hypothetical protein
MARVIIHGKKVGDGGTTRVRSGLLVCVLLLCFPGGSFAQNNAVATADQVPWNNAVVSSAVDANGNPNFMAGFSGLTLPINGSPTKVVLYINGFLQIVNSNLSITLPNNAGTTYILVTQDLTHASLQASDFLAMNTPPVFSPTAPACPSPTLPLSATNPAYWFNQSTNQAMTCTSNNGVYAVASPPSIYVGSAVISGGAITSVAYVPFRTDPGAFGSAYLSGSLVSNGSGQIDLSASQASNAFRLQNGPSCGLNANGSLCYDTTANNIYALINGTRTAWSAGGGGGGGALSAITPATAGNTIANGNFPQQWNWQQTSNSQTGMRFGETAASTGGTLTNGIPNQVLMQLSTASGSTASPLLVNNSLTGTQVQCALCVNPTWNTTGVVDAGIFENVTGTGGAGSLLMDLQISNSSKFKVDTAGNVTATTITATGTGAGYIVYTDGTPPAGTAGTVTTGANPTSQFYVEQATGSPALVPLVGLDLSVPGTDSTQAQVVGLHLTAEGQVGSQALTVSIPAAVSGCRIGSLCVLAGATQLAATATVSQTNVQVYIATGPGAIGTNVTTGNVRLAQQGEATCVFDGTPAANDYVVASSTVAGDCHDLGPLPPNGFWIVGQAGPQVSGLNYSVVITAGATPLGSYPIVNVALDSPGVMYGGAGTLTFTLGSATVATSGSNWSAANVGSMVQYNSGTSPNFRAVVVAVGIGSITLNAPFPGPTTGAISYSAGLGTGTYNTLADGCAQIMASRANHPGATVDARNISANASTVPCSVNPAIATAADVTSNGVGGQIGLGNNVYDSWRTWTLPSGLWVQGMGRSPAGTTVNTLLSADAANFSNQYAVNLTAGVGSVTATLGGTTFIDSGQTFVVAATSAACDSGQYGHIVMPSTVTGVVEGQTVNLEGWTPAAWNTAAYVTGVSGHNIEVLFASACAAPTVVGSIDASLGKTMQGFFNGPTSGTVTSSGGTNGLYTFTVVLSGGASGFSSNDAGSCAVVAGGNSYTIASYTSSLVVSVMSATNPNFSGTAFTETCWIQGDVVATSTATIHALVLDRGMQHSVTSSNSITYTLGPPLVSFGAYAPATTGSELIGVGLSCNGVGGCGGLNTQQGSEQTLVQQVNVGAWSTFAVDMQGSSGRVTQLRSIQAQPANPAPVTATCLQYIDAAAGGNTQAGYGADSMTCQGPASAGGFPYAGFEISGSNLMLSNWHSASTVAGVRIGKYAAAVGADVLNGNPGPFVYNGVHVLAPAARQSVQIIGMSAATALGHDLIQDDSISSGCAAGTTDENDGGSSANILGIGEYVVAFNGTGTTRFTTDASVSNCSGATVATSGSFTGACTVAGSGASLGCITAPTTGTVTLPSAGASGSTDLYFGSAGVSQSVGAGTPIGVPGAGACPSGQFITAVPIATPPTCTSSTGGFQVYVDAFPGVDPTGATDSTAGTQAAINACAGKVSCDVYWNGTGHYLYNSMLTPPNGIYLHFHFAGARLTRNFDQTTTNMALMANAQTLSNTTALAAGATTGDLFISVSSLTGFSVGQWVLINDNTGQNGTGCVGGGPPGNGKCTGGNSLVSPPFPNWPSILSSNMEIGQIAALDSANTPNRILLRSSIENIPMTSISYNTGTCTFTQGSTSVTCSGTALTSSMVGGLVWCASTACNTNYGYISAVPTATSITLQANWQGPSGTGAAIQITNKQPFAYNPAQGGQVSVITPLHLDIDGGVFDYGPNCAIPNQCNGRLFSFWAWTDSVVKNVNVTMGRQVVAFELQGSRHVTFINNLFHDSQPPVSSTGQYGQGIGTLFSAYIDLTDNQFYNVGAAVWYSDQSYSCTASGNYVHGSSNGAFQTHYWRERNITFRHNVIDGSVWSTQDGTVTLTNGSTAVVGVGTSFAVSGVQLVATSGTCNGQSATVASVTNGTNLVLSSPGWTGTTCSGVTFYFTQINSSTGIYIADSASGIQVIDNDLMGCGNYCIQIAGASIFESDPTSNIYLKGNAIHTNTINLDESGGVVHNFQSVTPSSGIYIQYALGGHVDGLIDGWFVTNGFGIRIFGSPHFTVGPLNITQNNKSTASGGQVGLYFSTGTSSNLDEVVSNVHVRDFQNTNCRFDAAGANTTMTGTVSDTDCSQGSPNPYLWLNGTGATVNRMGNVGDSPPTQFVGNVGIAAHLNQVTANSDMAGVLNCSSGSVTKTFSTAYAATPVIVIEDDSTSGGARVSAKSGTSFTVTCTGGTDVVDYFVVGNPN